MLEVRKPPRRWSTRALAPMTPSRCVALDHPRSADRLPRSSSNCTGSDPGGAVAEVAGPHSPASNLIWADRTARSVQADRATAAAQGRLSRPAEPVEGIRVGGAVPTTSCPRLSPEAASWSPPTTHRRDEYPHKSPATGSRLHARGGFEELLRASTSTRSRDSRRCSPTPPRSRREAARARSSRPPASARRARWSGWQLGGRSTHSIAVRSPDSC